MAKKTSWCKSQRFISSSVVVVAFLAGILLTPDFALSSSEHIKLSPAAVNLTSVKSVKNAAPAGSLEGNLQVTATGAASYSIPIAIPPGTGGIAPQLSIAYSSQQDNGLLGMGFALQGLTAITRCPSNKAQNNVIHGVDYTDQDRFCLNGQQLVAIKGAYGQDGTEYRTYVDSAARIVSYGRQGNGPASFKVWVKGSQIAEYGFTGDSQVYAEGKPTIASWALNKIKDNAGNYFAVHYFQDNNVAYADKISYTGNEKAPTNPPNAVIFNYEDRPDGRDMYRAGSRLKMAKRLNSIQAYAENNLVYTYRFNYEQGPNTGRTRLTQMQKCDASGTCLPPTRFEWQTNAEGWTEAPQFNVKTWDIARGGVDTKVNFLDLDGDGLVDVVQKIIAKTAWQWIPHNSAWINNGSGWREAPEYLLKTGYTFRFGNAHEDLGVRFVDLNGDGLVDVVQKMLAGNDTTPIESAWLNTGAEWREAPDYKLRCEYITSRSKGGDHFSEDHGVRFVDLNGDGLTDVVQKTFTSDSMQLESEWINTGSGWREAPEFKLLTANITGNNGHDSTQDLGVRFLDLNGDGLADVIQKTWSGTDHAQWNSAWINTGSSWRSAAEYIPPPPSDNITTDGQDRGLRFEDLNKDGLPDLIWASDAGHGAWLNTGTGWIKNDGYWVVPKGFIYADGKDAGSRLIDINGDGFPDLVYAVDRGEPEYHGVWLNMPNNWYGKVNQGYWNMPKGIATADGKDNGLRFVDLEGTGLPAIVFKNDHDQGVWLNAAKKLPDYLIAITDGLNERVDITYKPLTDKSIYTKGHEAKYPDMDVQNTMYVVTQTASGNTSNDPKTQNNNNGQHITNYTYAGARHNHLGWGFLGFKQVTAQDQTTGIRTTTTYSQDYNKHNLFSPILTETKLANGTLIASIQNDWECAQKTTSANNAQNDAYYLPYIARTTSKSFKLDGAWVSTKTTETQIDNFNNPTLIVNHIQDNTGTYTTTTRNTYANRINDSLWSIGELTHAEVTTEAPNKPSITRTSNFSYNDANGILTQSVTSPDDDAFKVITTYERDIFGNIIKETVSGKDLETRVTTNEYDAYGRFVTKMTNALGHVTSQTIDPKFGKPSETFDVNNLKTIYQYDGFGRVKYQKRPDNVESSVEYLKCGDTWCPAGNAYVEIKRTTDSPVTATYYDSLNRKTATTSQGFDGRTIWENTQYDDLGRPVRTSLPHFENEAEYFSNMEYDVLGQMTKLTKADGSVIQMIYDGLTTTTINPLNQRTVKIVNARGNVIEVIDNLGKHSHYDYDAYGNLIAVTDAKGNVSKIEYDKLGRKTAIHDPDKGNWSYSYDVLGELTNQTDSLGQKTSFQYDKLGRMILRTDPSGTSSWEYDTAPHGIGKLAKVTGVAGEQKTKKMSRSDTSGQSSVVSHLSSDNATGAEIIKAFRDGLMNYTRTYVYDELSRPTETDVKINDQTYYQKTSYDKDSRPDVLIYVNGLQVKNHYNNLGYLTQITNNATNALYQQINTMDAQQHVTSMTHSNGLITLNTYDPRNGFLTDINTGLSTALAVQKKMFPGITAVDKTIPQDFHVAAGFSPRTDNGANPRGLKPAATSSYEDGINGQIQAAHYIYDQLGNIKERDDNIVKRVETFGHDDLNRLTQNTDSVSGTTTTYQYDEIGNLAYKSDVGKYTYGEDGAGPHAVTRIEGNLPSKFSYDKNGDQILGMLGAETRQITYTSYSKPLFIKTDKAEVQFLYNADRDRFVRIDKVGKKTTTTFYLGNSELVSTDDGTGVTTEYKNYIGSALSIEKHSPSQIKNNPKSPVGAGFSLRPEISYDANGSEITTNLYTLLTDNLGSVVAITDEQANITQRFYYTPFGEQRQIDGKALDAPLTHKGFTGHEEVECVNLIHMSGRMYDPRIGRFLSADPFVQDYENPQTLNRYSYCLNNPITFTDPSGYWSLSDFFDSICDIFKNLFSANGLTSLLGIAIAALAFANPLFGLTRVMFSAIATAAYSGAVSAASGGNLQSVLFAVGSSFLTSMIWKGTGDFLEHLTEKVGDFEKFAERTLVHGMVGGGIQATEGGSFKDGFLGAAVAEAVDCRFSNTKDDGNLALLTSERVTSAYIIGGTAAALTGGNFQNGAMTAAYAELFNAVAHEAEKAAQKLITVDEGQKIVDAAAEWEGTKYADKKTNYAGPNAVNQLGGDCSGINHASYKEAGFDYPYKTANEFAKTSGGGHFAKVDTPQIGDTVSWSGRNHHLGIYAGSGQMWTTHTYGNNMEYGLDKIKYFSRDFGYSPSYYRYRED